MKLIKNLNLILKRKLSSFDVKAFGVDIGGTLTKVVTFSRDENGFNYDDIVFSKVLRIFIF